MKATTIIIVLIILLAALLPAANAAGCTRTAKPIGGYYNRFAVAYDYAQHDRWEARLYGGLVRGSVRIDVCTPAWAWYAGKFRWFYKISGSRLYVSAAGVKVQ